MWQNQSLWFFHIDRTIPLHSKSEISSLKPSSVAVQPGLCQTCSETTKTGFLVAWLILSYHLSLCCFYTKDMKVNKMWAQNLTSRHWIAGHVKNKLAASMKSITV